MTDFTAGTREPATVPNGYSDHPHYTRLSFADSVEVIKPYQQADNDDLLLYDQDYKLDNPLAIRYLYGNSMFIYQVQVVIFIVIKAK